MSGRAASTTAPGRARLPPSHGLATAPARFKPQTPARREARPPIETLSAPLCDTVDTNDSSKRKLALARYDAATGYALNRMFLALEARLVPWMGKS